MLHSQFFMSVRSFRESDQSLVDELCRLSWNQPEQGTGYPRVEDFHELQVEIESYNNKPEECLKVLLDEGVAVGYYGFLWEPGEDVAFLIGPVVHTKYHKSEIYHKLLEHIESEADALFTRLISSVSKQNQLFYQTIEGKWCKRYEEIEMGFDVQRKELVENQYPIANLSKGDLLFKSISQLLGSIDGWENPCEELKAYMEEDGMKVSYITENESLMGALMWDEMEGTNFWRLEDVAVVEEYRGKGVATVLIYDLLARAKHYNAKSLFLSVEKDNKSAYKLYKNLGFYETVRTCSFSYNVNESKVL